jgi:D-3-phosphoglycerate dehydrogenase / 2-oxoglutarate reductase
VFNIVVATDLTEESLALLHDATDIALTVVPPSSHNLRDALKDAHAIIARDDLFLDSELLDHAPQLKIIAKPTASLSGVDIDTATARGVIVMNTPGASAIAAAEHAMTLMLALSRRLVEAHNSMRSGYWLLDRKRQAGTQLQSKTLGIIGLGRVGRVVAQRALAFGMNVIAFDPYVSEDNIGDQRVQLLGLRELLSLSDFVSIHVPETRETRGLLDRDRITQIKPGARLINTAYGGVWDEAAIAEALESGQLSGIATDVYVEEPPYNSPLIGINNVVHTPHIGDNTLEATQDLSLQVVQQLLDALHDVDYRNVVNMPLLPGMDYETVRPYMLLAERMGLIQHALSRHPVKRVAVELVGDDVSGLIKPVMVALLKGLLTPVLGETVSYINAPLLASERNIQVGQVKGVGVTDYANVITCKITLEDEEEMIISGTLLDRREPHIMQINEYRMNFVPKGKLLLMGSYDQPGVIGKVGTLMAQNNVNIASWHTGRAQPGGQTLTVLNLDAPIPDDVMEALLQQDFIRHAHQVEIG